MSGAHDDGTAAVAPSRALRWLVRLAAGVITAASVALPAGAQSVETVTVEQRVLLSPGLTSEDARRRAIEEGLADAVRRVAGVRVQSTALSVLEERPSAGSGGTNRGGAGSERVNSGSAISGGWSSVVQLDAAARAVDYRVEDEEWLTLRHPELGAQLYLRIRLMVSVARERGAPDPSYSATVELDATRYTARSHEPAANDEIRATVTASRPSHVTAFVISEDSAERLLPNDYIGEVRVAAGVAQELPPAEWRARGIRFRATLAAGRTAMRSLFMVVATLDRVEPPADRRLSVLDVQRWLVRIPADRRTLAFAAFETVR